MEDLLKLINGSSIDCAINQAMKHIRPIINLIVYLMVQFVEETIHQFQIYR